MCRYMNTEMCAANTHNTKKVREALQVTQATKTVSRGHNKVLSLAGTHLEHSYRGLKTTAPLLGDSGQGGTRRWTTSSEGSGPWIETQLRCSICDFTEVLKSVAMNKPQNVTAVSRPPETLRSPSALVAACFSVFWWSWECLRHICLFVCVCCVQCVELPVSRRNKCQ